MSRYPRVTIEFCTQCRWMLRAAYFGQELLSTFSTALGEVALQPSTGGRFVVSVKTPSQEIVIWDRKERGGFPEAKVLKQLVRDIIQPDRDLGHSDRKGHKANEVLYVNTTGAHTATDVDGEKESLDNANAEVELKQSGEYHCEECKPLAPHID